MPWSMAENHPSTPLLPDRPVCAPFASSTSLRRARYTRTKSISWRPRWETRPASCPSRDGTSPNRSRPGDTRRARRRSSCRSPCRSRARTAAPARARRDRARCPEIGARVQPAAPADRPARKPKREPSPPPARPRTPRRRGRPDLGAASTSRAQPCRRLAQDHRRTARQRFQGDAPRARGGHRGYRCAQPPPVGLSQRLAIHKLSRATSAMAEAIDDGVDVIKRA